MKTQLLIFCSVVMLALTAHAGVITYGSIANSGFIPDNSVVGLGSTASASGFSGAISAVTVNLNISGGYNGDLYAYLSYGGVLVPLLNRVGVSSADAIGYADTGFNVTLSSSGAHDVHLYGNFSPSFNGNGQLTGTWQPDGRAIDPQSPSSAFDAAGTVTFAALNGLDPNGTWTLFIADLSPGEQSQLLNWSLDITSLSAVPEPVNVALGIFGGVFLVVTLARSSRVRKFFHSASAH